MHRSLDFLRTLAEYRRLHIVVLLIHHHELSISEMTAMLDLRQTDVSQALAELRQARIVASRREGHTISYYLAKNRRELVEQIVSALLHQFPLCYLPLQSGQAVATPSGQGIHANQP
ncbi:MAG TPA: metalloregulator ArsR/SmtB family transcription factor [Deltaproteobacteria bacterium]|nr:metalloregulator ArsR/SmtB family transcription factor [Deltaproteobacteria bacterium]